MYCPNCMYYFDEQKGATAAICPSCGKELDVENNAFQLPIGTMIAGRYYIGKSIGQGGFGITYIGIDTKLELRVAVKEYYPQGLVARMSIYSNELTITAGDQQNTFEKQKQRFISEARILAEFENDPNVVRVRDIVSENSTVYIVMEYIDGITLDVYRKQHGNLSFPEAFTLLKPVMESLGKIHSKGLIHRDISPVNIMITNEDHHVKLLDFGSASNFEPDEDISRSVILKPGYAPAEQYSRHGEQGPWSDVYALCATIYRLITGVVPENAFERMGLDALKRPSELGAVISPEDEAVLMCGMAIQPGQRISSMGDLLEAFESARNHNLVKKAIPFFTSANNTAPADEHYDETMILSENESVPAYQKTYDEGESLTAGENRESNESTDRISDLMKNLSGRRKLLGLTAAVGIVFLLWIVISAASGSGGSEPAPVPVAAEDNSKQTDLQETAENDNGVEDKELTLVLDDSSIDLFTYTGLKVLFDDQTILPDDDKLTVAASDPEMVNIMKRNDSWVIGAWKPGTVLIRAYYGETKAEKELTINNVSPRLTLSDETVIVGETITAGIVVGNTAVLATANGVSGFSSNTDILDVETKGSSFTLKGISPGSADFTVDHYGETVTKTVVVLDRGEAYLSRARECEEQGDDRKAFDNYQVAAESGNAEAQCMLASLYDAGEVVEENKEEAVYWYQKAADQNNAEAINRLGVYYYYGDGVSEDCEKGIALIQKAVDMGDSSAMANLGRIYYYGRGVAKDDSLALKYLQMAADLDNTDAFMDLAFLYRNGVGTQKDLKKAEELEVRGFEAALEGTENGDTGCMYEAGIAYETGQGTEQDLEQAFRYFQMGADKNHTGCMAKVSQFYFEGKGNVKEDGSKAFKYAKAATEEGVDYFAWYRLGLCYEYGKGTEKNISKAIECYTVAADYGYAEAKERLDQLQAAN